MEKFLQEQTEKIANAFKLTTQTLQLVRELGDLGTLIPDLVDSADKSGYDRGKSESQASIIESAANVCDATARDYSYRAKEQAATGNYVEAAESGHYAYAAGVCGELIRKLNA